MIAYRPRSGHSPTRAKLSWHSPGESLNDAQSCPAFCTLGGMRTLFFLLTTALVSVSLSAFGAAVSDCHIGSYRLTDGSFIDIAPSEGETLRWRRLDGMTGALQKVEDET